MQWQSPDTNPDPATTKYRLYATPSTSGRRRFLEDGQTSTVELIPASGTGTAESPYTAAVSLSGEVVSSNGGQQLAQIAAQSAGTQPNGCKRWGTDVIVLLWPWVTFQQANHEAPA